MIPIEFKDRVIVCVDCNKDFVYSESEQRYFVSRGLIEPKRCQPCRAIRRESLKISRGGVK